MKKNFKCFASPFIMIGLVIMIVLAIAIWIFTLFFPFTNGRFIDDIPKFLDQVGFILIVPIIFAGVLPVLGFGLSCYKGFSVLEISEIGVKKSLFKIFRKTEIKWDEMREIRCYGMVRRWIFFSKTCLENMSYNMIIKRKDTLQIEYSEKIVELIHSFTDKEIINLPNE